MTKGIIISGGFGEILMRQHSGATIEIGELLIVPTEGRKILLSVSDLLYGSQLSSQNMELISGIQLEEGITGEFFDAHLRHYMLAKLKALLSLEGTGTNTLAKTAKTLPAVFSEVREVRAEDLGFLTKPEHALYVGELRSGSSVINVPVHLPGEEVLSHHVLVPATTGRGKSNLTSVILWNTLPEDYCGMLVLDPHDEYYGRKGPGLKDHPLARERLQYYTPQNPPPGSMSLRINVSLLRPHHFHGAIDWSDPQIEAMTAYYREFGGRWIENIIRGIKSRASFNEATIGVLQRRMMQLLDAEIQNQMVVYSGVFCDTGGETCVSDMVHALETSKTVVVDTSSFSGAEEILIGSLIATELFHRYKHMKTTGELAQKPVVSVVLEEAPRVLGKEVIERGPNIFSTIAREGRKFKVGLFAITQLPSLIPRSILANMNTKIILGLEMAPERTAIIESSAQDLTDQGRAIAALDKGEALLTSTFTRFAMPLKIPLFSHLVQAARKQPTRTFSGMEQS